MFESIFTEQLNNMSDWSTTSSYIQWSDYDSSADVMSYLAEIAVPNGGETLLDVYLVGASYDDSSVYFSAEVDGALEEITCVVYEDYNSTGLDAWTSEEQAYKPYVCSSVVSADTASFTIEAVYQDAFASTVTGLDLTSFMYDANYGDYTLLYRLIFWVR